jgi:hypothetical protein
MQKENERLIKHQTIEKINRTNDLCVLYKNLPMQKFIFIFLISFSLKAQVIPQAEPIEEPKEEQEEKPVLFEEPKPEWKQRLHYGGNIWASFWGSFYLDASPMVGYDISNKGTIVGLGASFIYRGAYQQSGNIAAGGRLFVRQAIWKSIFAQGEYELMNADVSNFYNSEVGATGRKWGGSPLVGLGFYQGRTGMQRGSFISVMYNLGSPSFGFISPQSLGGNGSPFVIRIGYFF